MRRPTGRFFTGWWAAPQLFTGPVVPSSTGFHRFGPVRIVAPAAVAVLYKFSSTTSSSREWLRRQRKDPYVRKSQADGYRARSAYKLVEIDKKFRLLKPGMSVLDCGAAPGSWSQVAADLVNAGGFRASVDRDASTSSSSSSGVVIGCDRANVVIEPVNGAVFLTGADFTDPETQKKILKALTDSSGLTRFDSVLSDMAPNASGNPELDHDRIVKLAYLALRFALLHSYPGGSFVAKLWQGGDRHRNGDGGVGGGGGRLFRDVARFYDRAEWFKPKSSRLDSAEVYVVGLGYKGLLNNKDEADPSETAAKK